MLGYYDLVLGLIPLILFGFAGGLYGLGMTLTTAVPIAAVLAAGLIGHAMFVRAPIDHPSPEPDPTPRSAPSAD